MSFLTLTSSYKWFIFIIWTIRGCLFFYRNFLSFILIFFNLKLGLYIWLFGLIILLNINNHIIFLAFFIFYFPMYFSHISLYIPPLPFLMLWTFNLFSTTLPIEVYNRKVINVYIIWRLCHYVDKILTKFFISWSLIRRREDMAGCFHQAFWSSI